MSEFVSNKDLFNILVLEKHLINAEPNMGSTIDEFVKKEYVDFEKGIYPAMNSGVDGAKIKYFSIPDDLLIFTIGENKGICKSVGFKTVIPCEYFELQKIQTHTKIMDKRKHMKGFDLILAKKRSALDSNIVLSDIYTKDGILVMENLTNIQFIFEENVDYIIDEWDTVQNITYKFGIEKRIKEFIVNMLIPKRAAEKINNIFYEEFSDVDAELEVIHDTSDGYSNNRYSIIGNIAYANHRYKDVNINDSIPISFLFPTSCFCDKRICKKYIDESRKLRSIGIEIIKEEFINNKEKEVSA